MAGLAGRPGREPGSEAGRPPGAGPAPGSLAQRHEDAQRPRAAYPDRAAPARRAGDARGSFAQVQHFARTRAPDRGPRVREAAEGDQVGGHGPTAAERELEPDPIKPNRFDR